MIKGKEKLKEAIQIAKKKRIEEEEKEREEEEERKRKKKEKEKENFSGKNLMDFLIIFLFRNS